MNKSSSRSTIDVTLPPWCTVELRDALDHETLFPKTYLDSDDTTDAEKQKLYFEVQPNASFEVLITVNFEHGSIFAPYHRLLLKLALDGEDVGFTKRCTSPFVHQKHKNRGKGHNQQRTSNTVIFDGYRKTLESGGYKILPFKFSETVLKDMKETANNSSSSSSSNHESSSSNNGKNSSEPSDRRGSLTVTVLEAYEDRSRPPKPFRPQSQERNGASHLKGFRGEEAIDKDKKFWKQPSVTVSCDDVNTSVREGGAGMSFPWRPRSEVPVWTWTAFYHTPNVLKILQLISKSEITAVNENQRIEPERDIYDESDDVVEIEEPTKKRSVPPIEIIDLSQEPKRKRKFTGIIDLTK